MMDRQKPRKSHESRKFTADGIDFSSNGRATHNEKSKYKRHSDRKKYEMNPNTYSPNWSSQTRFHPVSQRQYSPSESSVCHYSVPLSFSFEPVSLPIYPAVIQPQGGCILPLEVESHTNRSKRSKKHKNRKDISKTNSVVQNDPPAIFYTPKINSGDQQDYASLPPVNCDIYAAKSSDTEVVCRRRFSDPGIGPMSSDDCSSSRSEETSNSSQTAEVQPSDFYTLIEQINELKESNSFLKRELNETKMELEGFKMQSLNWKFGCEDFKPGSLSDAISEIRSAVKLGEEALISKVLQMLEKSSTECKEAQEKLEEKLRTEMNERLSKLEEQIEKSNSVSEKPSSRDLPDPSPKNKDADAQQQIVELEKEKFQLRKELQEAVAKRKSAEATTEKLERLVGILRKKINGVSLESCILEEKQILVRPLAASFEKNPFIIANNRQGQKSDTLPFSKPKVQTFKGFPLENSEGTNVVFVENKENENGEAGTVPSGPGGSLPPSEKPVTSQVTMTGPVTDL